MSLGITTAQLNFERLHEIGQEGRNSKVYLAHDKQLDAQLVIKELAKSTFRDHAEFYKEAIKLYDSEHQHVVQIKYACEDANSIYLAMPYYKKGSLKTLIDSRYLTVREIIRYATQFLSGLNHIHVKKLIHFDVKPDNILISDKNEALISDFGLTKSMNALGVADATAFYRKQLPPEVFTQSKHTMLYDIYNAGLTLYRMCNGNPHYNNQFLKINTDQKTYTEAIEKGIFPDRSLYLPHIPKALRKTINKALDVDQQKRQQTILELINDLSVIDTLLDWEFKFIGDVRVWTLNLEEKTLTVQVSEDNGTFTILTLKTMKDSGNTTKVHNSSKSNIVAKEIDKTINTFLLSLNE